MQLIQESNEKKGRKKHFCQNQTKLTCYKINPESNIWSSVKWDNKTKSVHQLRKWQQTSWAAAPCTVAVCVLCENMNFIHRRATKHTHCEGGQTRTSVSGPPLQLCWAEVTKTQTACLSWTHFMTFSVYEKMCDDRKREMSSDIPHSLWARGNWEKKKHTWSTWIRR